MRAVLQRLPVRLASEIGLATGTMGEQENGLIREPLAPRIHRANKRLYLWAREDAEHFLFFFPLFCKSDEPSFRARASCFAVSSALLRTTAHDPLTRARKPRNDTLGCESRCYSFSSLRRPAFLGRCTCLAERRFNFFLPFSRRSRSFCVAILSTCGFFPRNLVIVSNEQMAL